MTIQLVNKLSSLSFAETKHSRFFRFPFRYYVMIFSAFSGAFMFASRCVINVALLAMVSSAKSNSTHLMVSSLLTFILFNQTCPILIGYFYHSLSLSYYRHSVCHLRMKQAKFPPIQHLHSIGTKHNKE